MATWIEIRCERRGLTTEERKAAGMAKPCWSHGNVGPMDMACDDNRSILAVVADLRDEAAKSGWKRHGEGWVCPCCLPQVAKLPSAEFGSSG